MSLRFVESGGQYHFSKGVNPPGIWFSSTGALSSAVPSINGSTYGYSGGNMLQKTNVLGSFAGMIAGFRLNVGSLASSQLIIFYDSTGANQCDVRINNSGIFNFTRNGTVIGSSSSVVLTAGVWNYLEFKAIFSTTGTGTCEVVLNGITILTSTSLTNATGTALGAAAGFQQPNVSNCFARDYYVLDTAGGTYSTYLNDVSVEEIYPNTAGVNSAWTEATNNAGTGSPPPFVLTQATVSGATVIYTRSVTATGEAANAYQGYYMTVTGFIASSGANNGTFICTASSTTTITLGNSTGVNETHSGSMDFQVIVQAGIHGSAGDSFATTSVGTRPNDDAAYITSGTTNQISDFGHTGAQALSLTGSILGVAHVTYAKKDDAGTRQIAQTCISSGTTELSSSISLAGSYQYYQDILEVNPNTSVAWTVTNFNNATFGVKVV